MTRSQLTLAGTGLEKYTKTTRRAQFLAEMDRVVPWRDLCARVDRRTRRPGTAGHRSASSACCGCTSSRTALEQLARRGARPRLDLPRGNDSLADELGDRQELRRFLAGPQTSATKLSRLGRPHPSGSSPRAGNSFASRPRPRRSSGSP